jgi:hypothetical protein
MRFVGMMLWCIGLNAALIVLCWLIGRFATDRWSWSQWLWWIPTPIALIAAVVATVAAFRPSFKRTKRRRRIARWLVITLAMFIWFIAAENRMLRAAPEVGSNSKAIKIAHWNVTVTRYSRGPDETVEQFVSLDSDITVLTGPGYLGWHEKVVAALGRGQQPVNFGPLVVLSRFPILSARPVVGADLAFVYIITIDTTAVLGRPLIVYAVDLPSKPRIKRMDLARRIRSMLDNAPQFNEAARSSFPPPDLVIGDFNITRGSASIDVLFPGMRYAYEEAGHGYGATFHRGWVLPLYHIDHMLVGSDVQALRYDIVDRGISRHFSQQAWIGPR